MNDLIKKGKKVFASTVLLTTIAWSIGFGALALPLAANAVASGDLIKGTGTAVYYYGADGKRYVFPYQSAYSSWYGVDFSAVQTLTDAELITIPFGGNVTVRPGKLAQVVSMDSPWKVMDPKVYAVEKGGVLRWVQTADVAAAIWGATWESQIVAIPESLLTNFTIGAEIAAAAGYNLATQQAVASINEDKGLVGVVVGGVSVALASDTPAAASVPKGASNWEFTKVNFTAGSADVSITGLKVTRSGLGADANISAVKLFIDGVQKGTSQSLGSTHQATFTLTASPITVPANSTVGVVLAADIAASPTAYDQHILGIASTADITTTATISGTFPINGNVMSLVNVSIGSATLSAGALNATADTGVDPDAVGYRFSQIKISAGATEDIVVEQLTVIKNGTAASTDVKNIEIYNDTNSTSLGTKAALDANGRAVFSNLNLQIAKGSNKELSIKADMAGGSGRSIGFDVHDGTSFTMLIKGMTYNAGITPTGTAAFCKTGATDYICWQQTINQGYLTVSKSALAPATGNVPVGGSGVPLMAFDFAAAGEPINVSQTAVRYTTVTGLREEVTNVTLYKADGTILAGPKNGASTGAGTETLTFTDAYTLPIGTTVVYIKADLSSAMSAGDTVMVDMAANAITARGATSGKTTYTTSAGAVVPPATAITGNTMTLQGPALAIVTAATPIAGNMVVNAQDQVFAYFDLDASGGGEDIRVSSVTVTDTLGGAASAYTGLNNLELWGDPDTSDATTQNVRLVTSNSTATNAATVTFTFQTPIIVGKTTASRLTLKADVTTLWDTDDTGTADTHTYKVAAGGDVVATGKTTGNTASKTASGAGQAQTLRQSGTLKVERAADMPSAAQLVSSSTGNEVMKYKFTTQYEPIDVTTMTLFCGDNAQSEILCTRANINRLYVYADGTLVGNAAGYTLDADGRASVVLTSGTLVIPKDGYKTVTIKADLPDKTQVTTSTGANLQIGIEAAATDGAAQDKDDTWGDAAGDQDYWIVATGQSSGATISKDTINSTASATSGQVFGSNGFSAHKGILTVSLHASSPSGTQTPGANKEVLRLNLTATGDDIIVRELELVNSGTAVITGAGHVFVRSEDLGTTFAEVTDTECDTYNAAAGGAICLDPTATASFNIGPTTATCGVASATGDVCTGKWASADNLQIATGTTKVIRIFGDTTGAASTKVYQMSVSNAAANKVTTYGVTYRDSSGTDVGDRTSSTDSTHPATKNLPLAGGSLVY
jgi:hypothetical protein